MSPRRWQGCDIPRGRAFVAVASRRRADLAAGQTLRAAPANEGGLLHGITDPDGRGTVGRRHCRARVPAGERPGADFALSEARGRPLILAFYPADWSPVCGDELALYQELCRSSRFDAELVGISVDGSGATRVHRGSQPAFPAACRTSSRRARSPARTARIALRTERVERALFVIDANGNVRWSYLSPVGHESGRRRHLARPLERLPRERSSTRTLVLPVGEDRDHVEGPRSAPVTLVEYGDYECPYCGPRIRSSKSCRSAMGDELLLRVPQLPDDASRIRTRRKPPKQRRRRPPRERFWAMHDTSREPASLEDETTWAYAERVGTRYGPVRTRAGSRRVPRARARGFHERRAQRRERDADVLREWRTVRRLLGVRAIPRKSASRDGSSPRGHWPPLRAASPSGANRSPSPGCGEGLRCGGVRS